MSKILVKLTVDTDALDRLTAQADREHVDRGRFLAWVLEDVASAYPPAPPPERPAFAARRDERIRELAETHTPSKIARHYGTQTEVINLVLARGTGTGTHRGGDA